MGEETHCTLPFVSRDVVLDSCVGVCQDGTFLERDSSRGLSEQPYTLMVLFLDKVYNIQIRLEGGQYSLGTGLNGFQVNPTTTHPP